jgi:hypothetical protein
MGAPHRRTIYIATLEAHIDCLHAQLLAIGLYPVPFERLEPFKGLNCKTAKVGHFCMFFMNTLIRVVPCRVWSLGCNTMPVMSR